MRTNLHHLVEHAARSHPDSPALTFKKETLNYDALWTQVRGVAAGLRELGVAREQRVAVYLDKRIETVVAIFGASAAGAAFVPVNPLLRPAQVGHILRDCDVRVLVTSPERLALLRDELTSCPTVEDVVLVGAGIEEAEPSAHYRVHGWEQLRGSDARGARAERDRPRHRRHPVHLGKHGQTQGRGAQPPQPDRRCRERGHVSRQHRRRRASCRAAAELRRGIQPADDRLRGGCACDLDELPAPW